MPPPFDGVIKLDLGSKNFSHYKEVLIYCFAEALKTLPDDVRDWPTETATRKALIGNIPGNLGGMVLDIAVTSVKNTIPPTSFKA